MNAKPFLDTNILIYAFASNDPRSEQAEALLAAGGMISVQVLNEFVNVARRKLRREWAEIEDALGVLLARDVGFSFYDSLIIAAAIRAGCPVLYSEDLQDGQIVHGVRFRNPFG